MDRQLTLKEKQTIKQFVMQMHQTVNKLQHCQTYEHVKEYAKSADTFLDSNAAVCNFKSLLDNIHNTLEKK